MVKGYGDFSGQRHRPHEGVNVEAKRDMGRWKERGGRVVEK